MASIGKLHLGATEDENSIIHPSAIVCSLLAPFKKDLQWCNANGDWLVTAKEGSSYICARNQQILSIEEIKREGVGALTQALDLFSVHLNQTANLTNAGDNFILLYRENGKQTLCFTATYDLSISMSLRIEVKDKDGNIKPEPPPPIPCWDRSFRYYRLSQLAADVYEAYRNLYLSFEAIVESLFPRQQNEREGAWIRRCFQTLHQKYDLTVFAPEGHSAPNEYLFGTLYESTRCNLFHSRTTNTILPYYEVNALEIHTAYRSLLRIWRQIAAATFNTESSGGVVTYQGYRSSMDNRFAQPVTVSVTDDPAQVKGSDISIASTDYRVSALTTCRYVGEVSPGVVRIEASEHEPRSLPLICRLGIQINDILYAASGIDGGLSLAGIDHFGVVLNQRLVQGSQPKEQF